MAYFTAPVGPYNAHIPCSLSILFTAAFVIIAELGLGGEGEAVLGKLWPGLLEGMF